MLPGFIAAIQDTHDTARADLFDCIEMYHNRSRRHFTLGWQSPTQFALSQYRRRGAVVIHQAPRLSVLFVCLGNICRSPTAEAVFRERAARAGLGDRIFVDSAGTGSWHVGHPPDRRAIAHAARRGYDLAPLRARQVTREDFRRFGWILAMDEDNLRDLAALRPDAFDGHLGLMLEVAPSLRVREVPDPYYGGGDGFERVLDLLEEASERLIERVESGLRG